MEQIYRRRAERRANIRNENEQTPPSYKQTVLQQAAVCTLLFVGALFVKMSPSENTQFASQSIQYILTAGTDYKQMLQNAKDNFSKSFLKTQTETNELDSLTNLTPPLTTEIESPFGIRQDPISGEDAFHYGVDFSGTEGEKIKCVSDGIAEEIGSNAEYGNYILIRHGETYASFYAHCDKILPVKGDTIQAGQVIATVGSSGNAAAPHLHFEIRDGDTSLDPSVFLNTDKDTP